MAATAATPGCSDPPGRRLGRQLELAVRRGGGGGGAVVSGGASTSSISAQIDPGVSRRWCRSRRRSSPPSRAAPDLNARRNALHRRCRRATARSSARFPTRARRTSARSAASPSARRGRHRPRSRRAVLETLSVAPRQPRGAREQALDCGKPIAESRSTSRPAQRWPVLRRGGASCATSRSTRRGSSRRTARASSRRPPACVGAVSPWNYPLMQAVVAPALAAGCATVLKPSPLASLTCCASASWRLTPARPPARSRRHRRAAGRSRGARRRSSLPRHLPSFTGSGRASAAARVGQALRPTLELGGKGAAIVFGDTDVATAVDWACVGIFACAGQVCSATSRLLVHESIHDDVVAALPRRRRHPHRRPARRRHGGGPARLRRPAMLPRRPRRRAPGGPRPAGGGAAASAASPPGAVEPTVLAAPRAAARGDEIFGPCSR